MRYIKNVIKSILAKLPERMSIFLRNQISLANIPYKKKTVISDLFPFRIHDGWETHFELLNVPNLIEPNNQVDQTYIAKFLFFDESGNLFFEWTKSQKGCLRQTIFINEILQGKSISGYGTFACFHEKFIPNLLEQGGFLAERGYTGYRNSRISKVKGYVHGNLDALAKDINNDILCLGKSFKYKKHEYRLQHQLEGAATYELGFVNTTSKEQVLKVELLSLTNESLQIVSEKIPSKGIKWFSFKINENEPKRAVIHSKINLPRPVVFRMENKSFDVFHG